MSFALPLRFNETPQLSKIANYLVLVDDPEFSITDYEGQSYVVRISVDGNYSLRLNEVETTLHGLDVSKLFHVRKNRSTSFVPIDGRGGFLGLGETHCDFILFDSFNFCFVELKLNASSLEERAIRKNRKKAIGQLTNTILAFDELLEGNYDGLDLEAYVCTPKSYPRDDASWKSLAVAFLEKNGIPIFEVNEKTCR